MIEFDDDDFFTYQDHSDLPVISIAWLYMMLRCHGVDYAVGEA